MPELPELPHGLKREAHYVVGFSGGKDSVATWLYLTRELSLPHVTCTFADTGHESIQTLLYLCRLRDSHRLPLAFVQPRLIDMKGELKPDKMKDRLGGLTIDHPDFWQQRLTMETLAILKRRFASSADALVVRTWHDDPYDQCDGMLLTVCRPCEAAEDEE